MLALKIEHMQKLVLLVFWLSPQRSWGGVWEHLKGWPMVCPLRSHGAFCLAQSGASLQRQSPTAMCAMDVCLTGCQPLGCCDPVQHTA